MRLDHQWKKNVSDQLTPEESEKYGGRIKEIKEILHEDWKNAQKWMQKPLRGVDDCRMSYDSDPPTYEDFETAVLYRVEEKIKTIEQLIGRTLKRK